MTDVTYSAEGLAAIERHLSAANHDEVDPTCPVCVDLTVRSSIIVGGDGVGRYIRQVKARRMSDGRQPGDVVKGGTITVEVCPTCGSEVPAK